MVGVGGPAGAPLAVGFGDRVEGLSIRHAVYRT
jgi:hypothetical protein